MAFLHQQFLSSVPRIDSLYILCIFCITWQEVISSCGGDLSSALAWLELHTLNFSNNNIHSLDQSLVSTLILGMASKWVFHQNVWAGEVLWRPRWIDVCTRSATVCGLTALERSIECFNCLRQVEIILAVGVPTVEAYGQEGKGTYWGLIDASRF